MREIALLRRLVVGARQLRTRSIDAFLNIETAQRQGIGGRPVSARFGDGVPFAALDYLAIRRCLKSVELGPEDVFVDIGCGNGRVVCVAARRRIKKCVGIEYRAELTELAADNARSLRRRHCPIEIITGDAAVQDYAEGTVFWMFNPFGMETMQRVAENLAQSLRDFPRHVRIIYVRPLHGDVLESYGFVRTKTVALPGFNAGTAGYWTNRPDGT